MVAHTFNPITQEVEQVDLCEYQASLVYIVSFKTVRDSVKDSVSMNKQTRKERGRETSETVQ